MFSQAPNVRGTYMPELWRQRSKLLIIPVTKIALEPKAYASLLDLERNFTEEGVNIVWFIAWFIAG